MHFSRKDAQPREDATRSAAETRSALGSPRMSRLHENPLVLFQIGVCSRCFRELGSHELRQGSSRGRAETYGCQ